MLFISPSVGGVLTSSVPPFSLDAYASQVPGAWSMARSLYNGSKTSFRLRNSNSAGVIDVSADQYGSLSSFSSIRDGVGELRVHTSYNQSTIVGAWPNFTQATASSQLIFELGDGTTNYKIGGRFSGRNDTTRSLAMSTTQSPGSSWAIAMVLYYTGDYADGRLGAGGSGTGYHTWVGQHNTNDRWYYRDLNSGITADNWGPMASYDTGSPNATWSKYANRPLVYGVRVKSGTAELYLNGWKASTASPASPNALKLVYWGQTPSGINFNGYQAEVVVFNNADSSGFTEYMDGALKFFDGKPNIILAGDSRTTGAGATGSPLMTVGYQLSAGSYYPVQLVATVGHRTDQVNSSLTTPLANFGARFTGDTKKNIIVYDAGINDIIQAVSEPTILANIASGISAIRSAGCYAVVCTPADCSTSYANVTPQKMASLAAGIRALSSDGVVDQYANAYIGGGTSGNSTYFTDGLHHTNAGQLIKANLIKAALDNLSRY